MEKKNLMLPYIIWTIRRTGGTSFTSLLDNLSSYPSLEHEPFNKNRVYGYITHKYHAGEESTVDEIYQILKDKPNIKHCFEIIPEQINLNILKATQLLGYNQIFLYRSDQAARTMSLILSQATNVWGPKQTARYAPYLNREKKLTIPNDHACRRKMQSDQHLSETMYKHIQKNHRLYSLNLNNYIKSVRCLEKHTYSISLAVWAYMEPLMKK